MAGGKYDAQRSHSRPQEPQRRGPSNAAPPRHNRASSNYFRLEADVRRTGAQYDGDNFSGRLSMMNVIPNNSQYPNTNGYNPNLPSTYEQNQSSTQRRPGEGGGLHSDFEDEISIDFCCEVLYRKYGFQSGSVDNQREHVLLLLANAKARAKSNAAPGHHVAELHKKLFSNYIEWCEFLKIKPLSYKGEVRGNLKNLKHMEILLFLLIWGESANLRHMPECLCYLYHQMLGMLNKDYLGEETQSEGWFLRSIVRPVWKVASNMQRKNSLGKHLEHVKVRNYDDINEYFWKAHCVTIPVLQIGHELENNHGKTFYEHRSIFTLILNYFRIFQFNFMYFVVLSYIAFTSAVSPHGGYEWFPQFQSMGQVVEPFLPRDLKIAQASVVLCHASAATLKCVLEVGHGWHLLTTNESSKTSSRSLNYASALFLRLLWNGFFMALFGRIVYTSLKTGVDSPYLPQTTTFAVAFVTPALCILLAQAFVPAAVMKSAAANFVREGESCYVGRHMAPPLQAQFKYIIFWLILWALKTWISYFILVRPLMLPSLVIYSMKLDYGKEIIAFHNMGLIAALWLPVVFIFNYDTQIYFTVFQALLGIAQGLKMKTGELHGIKMISNAFRVAPQLFDRKVVTKLARSNDAGADAGNKSKEEGNAAYQSQMMLRFVVVWNEIVNSFREGDLVDDKEAAILQYDIHGSGDVYEPVFLSAGKLQQAVEYAVKLGKDNGSDSQLQVFMMKNDCLSAVKSFFTAGMCLFEALLGSQDADVLEALREIEDIAIKGRFMASFAVQSLDALKLVTADFLEAVIELPDPSVDSRHGKVHTMGIIRNFVTKTEALFNAIRSFAGGKAEIARKLNGIAFTSNNDGYAAAARGLVNLVESDAAMGAATRAYLLLSLDKSEAMPRVPEAQRRLGFFMKSLVMDIPQLTSIKDMHSFSVVTPFYSESVLTGLDELHNPLANHPVFKKVEEGGKNITILKYLITIHPEEWENFLERVGVSTQEEAIAQFPLELRLWASYRGQTLARTVQGMMLYEDAIKILHWLEIGSCETRTAEQKQAQLDDMVRLKFSYICACQVYGKHRAEKKAQADDIDYLLQTYPNLRVAYIDTIEQEGQKVHNSVLIKSENNEIVEVYRYELPGDAILGEGKPENQNNALQFTRGEYLQTIDMNQQHYFEECLKMPQLLVTADTHVSGKPVSIIGMREHIFTGNASSLSKFKSSQELVFVTLSQRVLADPLYVRMHYGHPDIFDKIIAVSRGGVSKASKGINLSEDVFAGFNSTLRGGIGTHVEFMQCGKGRDVALSQISMFEGKLANGAGETCLAREAHRMGQFMDFFRLNSMFYSHTGFYYATWMTIVTAFVYIYSKTYIAVVDVEAQMISEMNSTDIVLMNIERNFDQRLFTDLKAIVNTQFVVQAGTFLMLPLIGVYFGEGGLIRGMFRLLEMIVTGGFFFFVFQVGTTMHYFDNNIIHGGAKYQATGRGFKITRETMVLLYKAYAASHYRKAFELIGLCIVYGIFGNFHLGQSETNIGSDQFAKKYYGTEQGYWIQTFSIWSIALMWVIAPFWFNSDGLDWNKTKVDIKLWATWMFAKPDFKDDDTVNTGGWVTWWKGELEQFHNSSMMSRVAVIFRELRHFLLMFYLSTLETKEPKYAAYIFALSCATVFLLSFLHGFGMGMRVLPPIYRAGIYLLICIGLVLGYAGATWIVLGWKWKRIVSLMFAYISCLFGINESMRMWSFKSSSVAGNVMFQQLAFFFDFMFGSALVILVCLMSCIPFLNIIQTRMMYNEGFSKVMSGSGQYAISLAATMGLSGGTGAGMLFMVLSTLEQNSSFSSYVERYKNILGADGYLGDGYITLVFLCACGAGALISGGVNFFIGRRLSIVTAGFLNVFGLLCVTYADDGTSSGASMVERLTVPGIGFLGLSLGVLLPSLVIYIFEISTTDMRGKAILLVSLGFVGGMFTSSVLAEEGGWIWQVFFSSVLIGFITPAINLFAESPAWILDRKGREACEATLVILRRKPDVSEELKLMQSEDKGDDTSGSSSFKFLIAMALISVSSLSTGVLNSIIIEKTLSLMDQPLLMLTCLSFQLIGSVISFFFIDKVDHKSILYGTLIPVALLSGIMGVNEYKNLIDMSTPEGGVYFSLVAYLMYFFLGLGSVSVLWTSCVAMFTAKGRAMTTTSLFAMYFFTPVFYTIMKSNQELVGRVQYVYLYALAGACIVVMVLLMGAATKKNGIICTKKEAQDEKERLKRQRAVTTRQSRHSRAGTNVNRGRNVSLARQRGKSTAPHLGTPGPSPMPAGQYAGYQTPGPRGRGQQYGVL